MRMTFRHMDGVVSFSYNKGRPLFGMRHGGRFPYGMSWTDP